VEMTVASRDADRSRCSSCNMPVPDDELVIPESAPYVIHFCGLDCYAKWKSRALFMTPALAESPARRE
jgi:hypothetical protein